MHLTQFRQLWALKVLTSTLLTVPARLRRLGVHTVMVTGDVPATAAVVAKTIGLDGAAMAMLAACRGRSVINSQCKCKCECECQGGRLLVGSLLLYPPPREHGPEPGAHFCRVLRLKGRGHLPISRKLWLPNGKRRGDSSSTEARRQVFKFMGKVEADMSKDKIEVSRVVARCFA